MSGTILVTGGTGSFGRSVVTKLLRRNDYEKIIIYSRDEQKQEQMEYELADLAGGRLRFFIGDVRDKERLWMAMKGVSAVIHTAALKIVPAMEYNPIEAIKTNIIGAQNIIEVLCSNSINLNVNAPIKVIALSTDKAVQPVNLYGATKLCMEKLFIFANNLSGGTVKFSICRYGNVSGSRGSVIPLFVKRAKENKSLPITHPDMTRFWISLDTATSFVLDRMGNMHGGEVFVPNMPAYNIVDLANYFSNNHKIIGMRPGEKLHEEIITPYEMNYAHFSADHWVIMPPWTVPLGLPKLESMNSHTAYRLTIDELDVKLKEGGW